MTPLPSDADRIVARVVRQLDREKKAKAELAPPPPVGQTRGRVTLAALIVAVPVFALLLFLNLSSRPLSDLLLPPPPALARQQAHDALDRVVSELYSFRDDFEVLPENLAEIGVPIDGDWTYTVTDTDRFTVSLSWHGQTVAFDSIPRQADALADRGSR